MKPRPRAQALGFCIPRDEASIERETTLIATLMITKGIEFPSGFLVKPDPPQDRAPCYSCLVREGYQPPPVALIPNKPLLFTGLKLRVSYKIVNYPKPERGNSTPFFLIH